MTVVWLIASCLTAAHVHGPLHGPAKASLEAGQTADAGCPVHATPQGPADAPGQPDEHTQHECLVCQLAASAPLLASAPATTTESVCEHGVTDQALPAVVAVIASPVQPRAPPVLTSL